MSSIHSSGIGLSSPKRASVSTTRRRHLAPEVDVAGPGGRVSILVVKENLLVGGVLRRGVYTRLDLCPGRRSLDVAHTRTAAHLRYCRAKALRAVDLEAAKK